jgi:adenylate cyclase
MTSNSAALRTTFSPAIAYYVRKLLYQNLDRLQSVVAEGAGIRADSLSDLNAVVESLYLDAPEIAATIDQVETLAMQHQQYGGYGSQHHEERQAAEKQILWLLGYKYRDTVEHRGNILVVDDTLTNLRLLNAALSKHGYQVDTAENGKAAIASLQECTPDLVLLDIMMPDLDGYEVCKRLKERTLTRDVPIIFISTIDSPVDKVKAFKAGAVDFIGKPFQLEEVIARIDSHLRLSDLQKRLTEQNLKLQQEFQERLDAEAKYRSIFENAIDGIFQTTPEGQYIDVNPALAQLYGFTDAEELKANLTNIADQLYIQPGRRNSINAYLQQHGKVLGAESEVRIKEGKSIWISEDIRAVTDKKGKVLHYEGIVRDITQRRKTEQELRHQRQESERLLLNILPKAIATRLKQTKELIADVVENVTILYADIENFTAFSRQVSPIDQVKLLNTLFCAFDQLVEQYKLEKIKTIRDTYIVAAGVPEANPDHATAIAEMAIAMQKLMAQFHPEYHLELRIGISTGTVTAGVVGTQKMTYDLWGDAVNLASRMQATGAAGKIQITAATYDLLKDQYQIEERGAIAVQGVGEMTTYWLIDRL